MRPSVALALEVILISIVLRLLLDMDIICHPKPLICLSNID
jgi:hypothetical protein